MTVTTPNTPASDTHPAAPAQATTDRARTPGLPTRVTTSVLVLVAFAGVSSWTLAENAAHVSASDPAQASIGSDTCVEEPVQVVEVCR